jgi:Pyridoxamine 5'-phosphate oxidase
MSTLVDDGRARYGGGVPEELDDAARAIIDSSLYMTIDTADRDGRPWVSPVYFAPDLRGGQFAAGVELAGLEPATSWVRSRRSPN